MACYMVQNVTDAGGMIFYSEWRNLSYEDAKRKFVVHLLNARRPFYPHAETSPVHHAMDLK